MGLHRVGHDWIDLAAAAAAMSKLRIKLPNKKTKMAVKNEVQIHLTRDTNLNTKLKMVERNERWFKWIERYPIFLDQKTYTIKMIILPIWSKFKQNPCKN